MSIQTRSKEGTSLSKGVKQVLVVDDSRFTMKKIVDMLEHVPYFKVVAKAKDGYEALAILKHIHVDVILLDLFMPKCDGLSFLKHSQMDDVLPSKTKVIVLSEIQDDNVIEQALQWGAHYVLFKPFTAQVLIERLRILSEPPKTEILDKQRYEAHIIKYLLESGLPSHTFGYQYFRIAISYVLQESKEVLSITKTIYPYVAELCKTSSGNVDKAMRHSVMLAYEQNSERFQRFLIAMNYKDPTRKPSNSQFIGMILEKIKQELHRTHS